MNTIVARKIFPVSKLTLWRQLGNFDDMSWHPSIARCDATTRGLGRTRDIQLIDGGRVQDELLEIGPWHYRSKRVRSAAEPHRHTSEIRVYSTPTGGSSLEWTAIYDAMERPNAMARDQLERWMHQGLDAVSHALLESV